jgi:hypothetical protein
MPEPIPRRVPLSAFAWFFLSVFGLPKKVIGSASHCVPRTRLFAGLFSRLQLFVMFKPHSLLASQIVPTAANIPAGRPRLLCPSRTCVVTFARIGYAIRLTTGNWRNEDFHLARFAALSAAHTSSQAFDSFPMYLIYRFEHVVAAVDQQSAGCMFCRVHLSISPPDGIRTPLEHHRLFTLAVCRFPCSPAVVIRYSFLNIDRSSVCSTIAAHRFDSGR